MFSNSLKMKKIDRNMSELWEIVGKNIILTLVHFLGFIVWITQNKITIENLNLEAYFLFCNSKSIWLMRGTGNEDPHDEISTISLVLLPP